jgi:predicted RND superfamily exporter protein
MILQEQFPTDNPKYLEYLHFKEKFGEDGNLMTIGFLDKDLFELQKFNNLLDFHNDLKNTEGVDDVISIATAINLVKNDSTEKLDARQIFPKHINSQQELDSLAASFKGLPFYKGLMYNSSSGAWLLGVRINKNILNSKQRDRIVPLVTEKAYAFGKANNYEIRLSGLPLIRSNLAIRLSREMQFFLIGSLLLSAVILWLFFRSVRTTLLSLTVVLIGVIFAFATIYLLGFKITVLNALIPPLVVVIGVPNCIYFLNKYHTSFITKDNKMEALADMVSKMGIVTLFCNISAAIGFAVFALTKSAVLKEFGIVAGINIMVIFFISMILLPAALSYLPEPKEKHLDYLDNKWLAGILTKIEKWVFSHKNTVYGITIVVVAFSVTGMLKLNAQGFIVDDLPKTDVIYSDLKFFEKHFEGVMPLEILIDTKKKNGFVGIRALETFQKIDSFSTEIASSPEMARPLSLAEGLKFAKQGFYDGDSNNYVMPNTFDGAFVADYMRNEERSQRHKRQLSKVDAGIHGQQQAGYPG